MSDVISEYQKWKQQGDDLRLKAKQAMESRFRELLSEAARIAEEYRADFGAVLKPPSPVTAFRYKAHAKTKSRKAGKLKSAGKVVRAEPQKGPASQKPNPKNKQTPEESGDRQAEARRGQSRRQADATSRR